MSILDIFRKKKKPFAVKVSYPMRFGDEIYLRVVLKDGYGVDKIIPVMNSVIIRIVPVKTQE